MKGKKLKEWFDENKTKLVDCRSDECEIKVTIDDFDVKITPSFPDSEFQAILSVDGETIVTFSSVDKISISSSQGIIYDGGWSSEINMHSIDFVVFHDWYIEFGVKK